MNEIKVKKKRRVLNFFYTILTSVSFILFYYTYIQYKKSPTTISTRTYPDVWKYEKKANKDNFAGIPLRADHDLWKQGSKFALRIRRIAKNCESEAKPDPINILIKI